MNHYAAREIQKDGKGTGLYHYTCENNGAIYPVGYCSKYVSCPTCGPANGFGQVHNKETGEWILCATCNGKGSVDAEHPCPGHSTKEEACKHYRDYEIDHARRLGPKESKWPKNKCDYPGCNDEATYSYIMAGFGDSFFCEKHANKESLQLVHPDVGEIWSS